MLNHIIMAVKYHFADNEKRIKILRKQGMRIGKGCVIDRKVEFAGENYLIKIGNNTRLTKGVKLITHDGGIWTLRKMGMLDESAVKYGTITIGNNCNIGWDSIILPGVRIGNNVVVGAGAVVTKNIPDNAVAAGVPARVIETIDLYYDKVKNQTEPLFFMSDNETKKYLTKKYLGEEK